MKKLIFVLTFIFAIVTVQAQFKTTTLHSGITYAEYGVDITLTNAVAQWWKVKAPQDWYTAQTVTVQLDSAGGNHTNVAVALYGRVSAQTSTWTAIGSAINWKGTTADTTIIYTNATENLYREFKILYTGTGTGVTTIDNQEFKQYFGLP